MKPSTIPSSTIVLLLLNLNLFAQPPSPEWTTRYNGPASKTDVGRAMCIDPAGNIYVTGGSEGKKGNRDIATIKYNSAGQQLWIARYNGTGDNDDYPYGIAVDALGNVYVTGHSWGASGNSDLVTIKYTPGGSQQWIDRYNGAINGNDEGMDVQIDQLGDIYVTGYCDAPAGPLTLYGNKVVTIKYNAAGVLWRATYNGPTTTETGNSVAIDGSGNVYIACRGSASGGLVLKYDGAGQFLWAVTDGSSNARKVLIDGPNNIVVTGWGATTSKYDASGTLVWQSIAPGTAAFQDMEKDDAGNVYVFGYNQMNGTSDFNTVKYDANGNQQWNKLLNGSANEIDLGRAIALDNDGNVYVTGMLTVSAGRSTITKAGTAKYNNAGDLQWLASYAGPENLAADGFDIAADEAGNVYVAGQAAWKTTNYDIVTIKYPADSPSFTSYGYNPQSWLPGLTLKTYPNPSQTTTTITFHLPTDENVRLSIYDLNGREVTVLVNGIKSAGDYIVNFESQKLTSGTYLCRLMAGKRMETRKLVLVGR